MPGFFDCMKEPPVKYGEDFPLFNRISIETHSKCNRRCGFCPISTGRRDFELKRMNRKVYEMLVRELADLGFTGIGSLFLLNEPFIDVDFLKFYVPEYRRALPDSCIYVSTNGDTIAGRGLDNLVRVYEAGVTVLNLNIYDTGEKGEQRALQYRQLAAAAERFAGVKVISTGKYKSYSAKKRVLAITDMRPDRLDPSSVDMWYDRTAETRPELVPQVHCARPHRHIVVLHDGDVPICCAIDPTIGDLRAGKFPDWSLKTIWNNDMFRQYRWYLQQAKRVLPGCSTCNHRMSYSHVVRKVEYNADGDVYDAK